MFRSLVNSLPTIGVFGVIIGVTTVGAILVALVLGRIYAGYQSLLGKPGVTGSVAASSLAKVDQVLTSRRTRLDISQDALPALLRYLLVIGLILFIVLSLPVSIEHGMARILAMGGIAAFLSFAFTLTVLLDYPFSGDDPVDNSIFKQGVLAQFWVVDKPAEPLDTLAVRPAGAPDIVGEWASPGAKNGVIIFRQVGDEIHGAYRADNGGFVGSIGPDGVPRGWWCEEPTHGTPEDAGEVEWRLLDTAPGNAPRLDGRLTDPGCGSGAGRNEPWLAPPRTCQHFLPELMQLTASTIRSSGIRFMKSAWSVFGLCR